MRVLMLEAGASLQFTHDTILFLQEMGYDLACVQFVPDYPA